MIPYAKPVLLVAMAASLSAGGWVARGWYEGDKQLAVMEDRVAIVALVRGDVSGIAAQVETKLAKLKANERVIDRGVIREIERPVYRNVCIGDRGVELLNAALRGEPATGSTEHAGEVPGRVNATQ